MATKKLSSPAVTWNKIEGVLEKKAMPTRDLTDARHLGSTAKTDTIYTRSSREINP